MAEGLLKAALKEAGRSDVDVDVISAGVAAMDGQSMSRETREILDAKGASVNGFRSQQVDQSLLQRADLVIAMTSSHADVVRHYFSADAGEVRILCDFVDPEQGLAGEDVADPIGMGKAAYVEVAEIMELAMPGVIDALTK